jgi:hypothetical protein
MLVQPLNCLLGRLCGRDDDDDGGGGASDRAVVT